MRDTLIILLDGSDLSASSWILVDADGALSAPAVCSEEAFLVLKQDRVVTVLVPTQDVLMLSVTLPAMSRSKLIQALPYALEEQLIDDVDTQHIVMGDMLESGELPVAVVSYEKMSLWLSQIKLWGLQANRMLPAALALPWTTNEWHMAITDMSFCRTGRDAGFAGDQAIIPDLLDAALWATAEKPEKLVIYQYDASDVIARLRNNRGNPELLSLPIEVRERGRSNLLTDLARSLVTASSMNLLQGKYAPKRQRLKQTKKIARVTTALAVIFVTLLFLMPLVSTLLLSGKANAINSKIAAIYYREFPNASSVVSPKRRMEDKLHKVTSQLGSNRFLLLMSYVGKAMAASPSVTIKKLQFQQNHLALEISAGSTADFTAFTDYLTHQSLSVKQQNATVVGTHVNAVVDVE